MGTANPSFTISVGVKFWSALKWPRFCFNVCDAGDSWVLPDALGSSASGHPDVLLSAALPSCLPAPVSPQPRLGPRQAHCLASHIRTARGQRPPRGNNRMRSCLEPGSLGERVMLSSLACPEQADSSLTGSSAPALCWGRLAVVHCPVFVWLPFFLWTAAAFLSTEMTPVPSFCVNNAHAYLWWAATQCDGHTL